LSPTRTEIQQMLAERLDFLMGVGHDMRAPLTGIAGFAAVLAELDSVANDPMASEAIAYIRHEASRLVELLNQLLYLGQVEQGIPRLEIETLDLGRLTRQTIEPLAVLHPSLTFRLVQSGEPVVAGDFLKLHRVLDNLIDNAIKHSPPGGAITVEVGSTGGEAWIAVSDEGEGVPVADRARVFERFVRLGRAEGNGAGIGLYIVQGLVAAHGGTVSVEDAPGARFVVRLPVGGEAIESGAADSYLSEENGQILVG
jgi:two-component system OmpR family sensor kinase